MEKRQLVPLGHTQQHSTLMRGTAPSPHLVDEYVLRLEVAVEYSVVVAEVEALQELSVEGLHGEGSGRSGQAAQTNTGSMEHTCTFTVLIFPRQVSKKRFKSFTGAR